MNTDLIKGAIDQIRSTLRGDADFAPVAFFEGLSGGLTIIAFDPAFLDSGARKNKLVQLLIKEAAERKSTCVHLVISAWMMDVPTNSDLSRIMRHGLGHEPEKEECVLIYTINRDGASCEYAMITGRSEQSAPRLSAFKRFDSLDVDRFSPGIVAAIQAVLN